MYDGWFFSWRMCSIRMIKSEGHLIRLKKLEQYYGNMYLTNYFKIRFKFYKYIIENRHFSFQKNLLSKGHTRLQEVQKAEGKIILNSTILMRL